MPKTRIIRQSFGSGELAYELFGRIDLEKYGGGVEKALNFITLPHGPAVNRPGTEFVAEVKTSSLKTRVISFSFSNQQTFCIELGAGYFRFFYNGAALTPGTPAAYSGATAYVIGDLVTQAGTVYYCIANTTGHAPPNATYWYAMPAGIYEIPNPYAEADLFRITYMQSGDVVTLCHPGYAPRELKRYGNTRWILGTISFASQTAAPASCTAVRTYPTAGTLKDFYYAVTALNEQGFEESPPSPTSAKIQNDLTITGNYNTISWPAVTGASRYNVYKYSNGTYGYIGQTASLSLIDDNILADMTRTIPFNLNPFTSANNYPAVMAYFEQRRFFGGTNNAPMNVWSTQSASDYNMSYSIPSQDSDALRFRIAAHRANAIRHIWPLQDLIILTASTEWRVFTSNNEALTPATLNIKAQSQNGASFVSPVAVNNILLYEQAQGGHIREMAYEWEKQGFTSNDISLLAPHLFDGFNIVEMGFARAPVPILWAVSSQGRLIGMTYAPEQKVAAWHRHETDGIFESVCTVTEGSADAVYFVIKRTIAGVEKRYIERLHARDFSTPADAFFVDCGLTYDGTAETVFTGLDHLEGKRVSILGDGAVMNPQTVIGGQVTVERAVAKAQIGLPIIADLKTLPTFFQDTAMGQASNKNVNKVWARVHHSGEFKAGPHEDALTAIKIRRFEPYGSPPDLRSDEVELVVMGDWNSSGQIIFRQDLPLPLSLLYVVSDVSIGG